MNQIIRRPAADRDLVEIFRHHARKAGLRVADRVFAEIEATFARLAGMPGMGTRFETDGPIYANLRFFPVSRYRDYLVFYRPIPGGIEVYRVLHGARDLGGILAEGFGIEGEVGGDEEEG